jgi:heme exporter protein A
MLAVPLKSSLAALSAQSPVATQAVPPVRTTGLTLQLDTRTILRSIDLTIRPGEFVAILGANGAGKSTLLRIISTIIRPSSGTLELFGQAVTRESAHLRSRIGLIAHQSMLYRELSARENLLFFARLHNVPSPVTRVDNLLQVMGLAHRSTDAIKTFSRGMVQRVAVARALLHDPDLLLADEPFDGLDAPSAESTGQLLTHLHGAGKTILLVNHDIASSLSLARRVIVLRQGSIVLDTSSAGLTVQSILSEMSAT